MRLLISLFSPSTGTWGGLTRGIAIADAAISAGHDVAFCASGYLEGVLRKRGYEVYTTPSTTMLGLPALLSQVLERRSQRASIPVKPGKSIGNIWLVLWLSGYARANYLRRLTEAEIEVAKAFRADRIFTDLNPGAFLMTAIMGIPVASAYAQIVTQGKGTWAWKLMNRATKKVLQSYGLSALIPDELFFGERVLKIIPSVPELDDADPDLPDVHYVGHLIGPIQEDTQTALNLDDENHYVFVYMGTGSVPLTVLQKVLPRVFPSDGKWRCFVGAQSITTPYQLGAVAFRPYVPADELLPRCDWTICHGGQNTIIQSLLNGVPLIVFPGAVFERRYNAGKVAKAGAGIMGEVDQFKFDWLIANLKERVVYASRAEKLGESMRSYGGPSTAVEAIEKWGG